LFISAICHLNAGFAVYHRTFEIMRIVPPLLFLIHTVYSLYYMSDAVAECGHAQRYYSYFL